LRIVGNADEVGAHLFHQLHVTTVHFVCQGNSDGLLVLMTANAA